MPYVFNQLDQAMKPENTDIFGQQPPQQQGAAGQGGATAPQRSTDGGSTVGAAAGSAGTAPPPAGINKVQSSVDQSAAFKQPGPSSDSFFSGIEKRQGELGKGLSDEVAAYNSAQSSKVNADPSIYLNRAYRADTDDAAQADIAKRLAATQAPRVDAYSSKVKLDNPAVAALSSPDMMRQYLKTQGGAGYTGGMSRLDQALMANNPGFKKQQGELLDRQSRLQQQQQEAASTVQNQAQSQLDSAYGHQTEDIRRDLQGRQNQILSSIQDRVNAENAARRGLRSTPDTDFANQSSQTALAKFSAENPDLAPYANQAGLNPLDYLSVGGDVGVSDMISEDEVGRYGRLNSLLGGGANKYTAAGGGAGPHEQFNADAYLAKLKETTPAARAAAAAAERQRQGEVVAGQLGAGGEKTQPSVRAGNIAIDTGDEGARLPPGWDQNVDLTAAPQPPPQIYQPGQVALDVSSDGGGGGVNPVAAAATPSPVDMPEGDIFKFFSDVRAKRDIHQPSSAAVNDLFGKLTPSQFSYKPGLGMEPGRHTGVMAQDLEKSSLGSQAVEKDPATGLKQVDYVKLFPAMTAALSDHNKRLRAIEAKKKGQV